MKVKLIGKITNEDIEQLKVLTNNDPVSLGKEPSKSLELHQVLSVVFEELKPGALLRDVIIEKTIEHIFLKIRSYFHEKREKDLTMEVDDEIDFLGKKIMLKISCHVDQFPGIYKQIEVKLTPHIQGIIPDGSTLIVRGQDDRISINILVIEKGSGKEYSL